jgi:hypothetical protein
MTHLPSPLVGEGSGERGLFDDSLNGLKNMMNEKLAA